MSPIVRDHRISEVPVLIVGAGPVGLATAGDLATRGVSSFIVERSNGEVFQPKMDLVNVRSMEFCRKWGIVDRVEQSGYPRNVKLDSLIVTSLTGYELGRFESPSLDATPFPPQSPQRRERCPQDMFDPILAEWATAFPQVALQYYAELVSFVEQSDHVLATVRDILTGVEWQIRCQYLLGCDGASSIVARALGVKKFGRTGLTHTTNVIFRCPELLTLHDKGEAYRYMIVGTEGVWATLVLISKGDEWRLSIVRTPRGGISWEDVAASIRRAVGRDFNFTIKTIVDWTRSELVADSYGSERVFIVGDAAHVMSPTGGFGMNTGLADAVDISWKIAAKLAGWGGASLLDSYTAERRGIAETNGRESSENLGRMLSVSELPELLNEDSEPGREYRATFGTAFSELVSKEWRTIGLMLGYRYDDSPICWPDGTPAPPLAIETYDQIARPGARAPHVWLCDGRSTLDLFGRNFVLLRFDGTTDTSTIEGAARAVDMPLDVVEIDNGEAHELYGAALCLVRPDGHVAWRGNEVPLEPQRLIDCVRGNVPFAWQVAPMAACSKREA